MQTDLQTISPDAPLNDAAVAMADAHVSGLPVVAADGRLVGVISSTDVLALEEELEDQSARTARFGSMQVRDVMTTQPVTITADATLTQAARLLLEAGVHRLFVTQGHRVIGVLSTTDILRTVADGRL